MFQSAPPCGGRPDRPCRPFRARIGVSIRAPVRGATRSLFGHPPLRRWRFNPRPRAGGDARARPFESRRFGFNPRPRAGGDSRRRRGRMLAMVSIRAPVRGATRFMWHVPSVSLVSIRAPVRGATQPFGAVLWAPGAWFQSAPPCGGRHPRSVRVCVWCGAVSIRAPVRGATRRQIPPAQG